jgi:delta24(24(1))-sterol reductase
MLIFWNISGVPYVYCFQSIYLLKNPWIDYSPLGMSLIIVVLLGAYYIWDTAQSQKNRFRMKLKGTYIPRFSFPQLPWGTL